MVVSSDLLLRLNLKRGDSVTLGDERFRIVAEVLVEPDRMTGTMNVGPPSADQPRGLGPC